MKMKKMSVVVAALGLTAVLFSGAIAGNGNGMGSGCGNCPQQSEAPVGAVQKFQADTIDLRQEMMTKRFEMQRENLKATPDEARIASLRGEIKTLQDKIVDIRSKSGLPTDKCDGECGPRMGGSGKGMGGCNKGPCGQK
jgi:hypothetical protein